MTGSQSEMGVFNE